MTACDRDDFPYEPADTRRGLRAAWDIAMGLQQVDGLRPSEYLKEVAAENVSGAITLDEAGIALRVYYKERDSSAPSRSSEREADFVSHRITELLSARGFMLAPAMLGRVHRYLFQDLDDSVYAPGEYKTEALAKKETILNGDSVLYGAPDLIDGALSLFFGRESAYVYGGDMNAPDLENFAGFLSHVWQVHPFKEGNTRTVAVFAALYLDSLGFDVGNEPFASNSRYFRDALVRANYRNAKAGVMPEMAYLIRFLENMLHDAGHELRSRDLMCEPLFRNPALLRNMPISEALVR